MRKARFVTILIGSVVAMTAVQSLYALCGIGRRVLPVQNSDIRLEPGVPAYLAVPVMSLGIPVPGNLVDCGLFAWSGLPGLSIVASYGSSPPLGNPPGVWTPIGASNNVDPQKPSPFIALPRYDFFSIRFDGQTPAGTQGSIIIGVNGADDGDPAEITPVGAINIYVGHLTPTPTWFTVASKSGNISGHRMAINHPLLNGNPNARLFIAHVYNPPGLIPQHWDHPIMTSYDGAKRRWVILNADGAKMNVGLGFNVRIDVSSSQYSTLRPESNPPVWHVTIDDPRANENPYATIAVSMTGWLAVNAHPIAVQYRGSRWRIVNSDGTLIPAGVRFNVKVMPYSAYHDINLEPSLDRFASNSAGISVLELHASPPPAPVPDTRLLDFWWQLGNPTLPMLVTPNQTPMGHFASTGGKYVGLKYVGGNRPRWSVIHEDGSNIPLDAAFNIFARPHPFVP